MPNTKLFVALIVVYFFTSLGHFSHNAEFICEYPNLPAWLTRAKVYAAWTAITSVGVLGIFLIRRRRVTAGLLLVAVYAAMGFDGLGHYSVAPTVLHTFTANLTILLEVGAAALLLAVTLHLLTQQLRSDNVMPGGIRGIERLEKQQAIRRATDEDIARWVAGAAQRLGQPVDAYRRKIDWRVRKDSVYVMLQGFELPDGLAGANARTFIIPEGASKPAGPQVHNTFLEMNGFQCYGAGCS